MFLNELTTKKDVYEIESEKYNWSVRELKTQYDSALYTRLALRDVAGVLKLSTRTDYRNQKTLLKTLILEFFVYQNYISIRNRN
jgi:predicted nuclease of restriction endonuclease-like (RecB) superfamily